MTIKWRGVGEIRNAYKIMVEKPEGKTTLGKLTCRWRIILKWILKIGCESVYWISGQGPVAGSCKHDNDSLGSIKVEEFFDQL
jgi:hypothetical protein